MKPTRRQFVAAALTIAAAGNPARAVEEKRKMYGIIGKIKAVPGQRDELIEILAAASSGMPGCLSYVVAQDGTDEDALWVTEVWEDQESHRASLGLESVQQAIAKGRPLIAGFEQRIETVPIGGHGISRKSEHLL